MFDNTITSSWDERSRRSITTLTSLAIQALAVGVLLVLPLLRPTVLPLLRQVSAPVSLGQPGEPPVTRPQLATGDTTSISPTIMLRPSSRLRLFAPGDASESAPVIPGCCGSIPGSPGPGAPGGLPISIADAPPPIMTIAPKPTPAPARISHMSEGDLIHKVFPTYPPLARSARIQGEVVLQAVISKQGIIKDLRVVSVHPMLAPAAIDAVRRWRYRPYILNNEPVEVETQITVNFSLSAN